MDETSKDPRATLAKTLKLRWPADESTAGRHLERFSEEEALYWIAKCAGSESALGIAALRLLIGLDAPSSQGGGPPSRLLT